MLYPTLIDSSYLSNLQFEGAVIEYINHYLLRYSNILNLLNNKINIDLINKISPLKKEVKDKNLVSFSSRFIKYDTDNVFDLLFSLNNYLDKLLREIQLDLNLVNKINAFDYSMFQNYFDFKLEVASPTTYHLGYKRGSNSFSFVKPSTITKFQDLSDTPSIANLTQPGIIVAEDATIAVKQFSDFYAPSVIYTSFTVNGTYDLSGSDCFNKIYMLNFGTCDGVYLKLGSSLEGGKTVFKCIETANAGNKLIFDTSEINVNFQNVSQIPLDIDNSYSFVYYQDSVKGQYICIEYHSE